MRSAPANVDFVVLPSDCKALVSLLNGFWEYPCLPHTPNATHMHIHNFKSKLTSGFHHHHLPILPLRSTMNHHKPARQVIGVSLSRRQLIEEQPVGATYKQAPVKGLQNLLLCFGVKCCRMPGISRWDSQVSAAEDGIRQMQLSMQAIHHNAL